MFIILTSFLVLVSLCMLFIKKSKESVLIFGLCVSLLLEITGVMIFIAKKGGVSSEIIDFFFIRKHIKNQIQYTLITLNQMGFLIAIGRTLFPYFLIQLAMNYSMVPIIRKNAWLCNMTSVLPLLTLVLYFPKFYRFIIHERPLVQVILVHMTLIWISVYLLIAIILLIVEYRSITMLFCKRQFRQILFCLCSLTCIYYLFYKQDPGQVYHFYWYNYKWNSGIGYMQVKPSLFSYLALISTSILCSTVGFYSLFHFTRRNYMDNKEDIVMERKFDYVKVGVSVFVHSMKNQLLSNRILYKRIRQVSQQETVDLEKILEYIASLEDTNTMMLNRIEELYRCVKSNAIYMTPIGVNDVIQLALDMVKKKNQDVTIDVLIDEEITVLADRNQFAEAIYNLVMNAYEATVGKVSIEEGMIQIVCYNERLYTVIEIRDNGCGMSKNILKKIFDPFYSNKNSNYNWGMGLYYVREIVKSHLGTLRVESVEGEGTKFFLMLPKYM